MSKRDEVSVFDRLRGSAITPALLRRIKRKVRERRKRFRDDPKAAAAFAARYSGQQ